MSLSCIHWIYEHAGGEEVDIAKRLTFTSDRVLFFRLSRYGGSTWTTPFPDERDGLHFSVAVLDDHDVPLGTIAIQKDARLTCRRVGPISGRLAAGRRVRKICNTFGGAERAFGSFGAEGLMDEGVAGVLRGANEETRRARTVATASQNSVGLVLSPRAAALTPRHAPLRYLWDAVSERGEEKRV